MGLMNSLYLIFIGFLSAFAITEILPLPLIILMVTLIVLVLLSLKNKIKIIIFKEDLIIVMIIIFSYISLILNGSEKKLINHTLAFTISIFFYYFVFRILLINSKLSFDNIRKYIFYGILISCIYCNFEFITKNFVESLSIINEYIYRPSVKIYTPIYNEMYIRARAFCEESGVLALYLNAFVPIILGYIKEKYRGVKKYLIYYLIISSYIFTFSAGGIGFLISSILLTMIMKFIFTKNKFQIDFKKVIIGIVFIGIILIFKNEILNYLEPLLDKMFLENDSGRFERWQKSIGVLKEGNFINNLFGIGMGGISFKFGTGTTNFYIDLIVQNGIIPFSFFLLFLLLIFIKILKIKDKYRYIYMISLISIVLHYFIISNFWFPFLWNIITFIQMHELIKKRGSY